mmetsp:Transcript_9615/g.10992  ORF Transcript_9615/g.10992 Transcript_9615/m.10992 type:complete len:308 (+) Transcript_9615:117-1040(+)
MRNSSNCTVVSGGSGGSATILSSTLSSLGTSKSSKLAASSSVNGSPSFARRRALKEADDTANQLRVLDCYPLSKYMAIADKLFGYFEEAFDSLRLDDAYVYGMRFAELAITNLPTHQDWRATSSATTAAGSAEDKLQSQIVKVVSRLEIIKRRMDEEESRKLRTGMLAQAEARVEEEGRRQQQVTRERREQEQRNTLIPAVIGGDNVCHPYSIPHHIDTSTTSSTITPPHLEEEQLSDGNWFPSTEIKNHEKSVTAGGKSPKSTLRQFLRIPKKVGLLSSWSLPAQEVSQPIVPSPDAIKQSRAQHW